MPPGGPARWVLKFGCFVCPCVRARGVGMESDAKALAELAQPPSVPGAAAASDIGEGSAPPPSAPPPPPLAGAPPLDDVALRELTRSSASRLRLLSLSENSIRGAGRALARLLRSPVLEELELAGCGLSTDDVGRVAAALQGSGLWRLELARNAIASKDRGVALVCAHIVCLPRCDSWSVDGRRLRLRWDGRSL